MLKLASEEADVLNRQDRETLNKKLQIDNGKRLLQTSAQPMRSLENAVVSANLKMTIRPQESRTMATETTLSWSGCEAVA